MERCLASFPTWGDSLFYAHTPASNLFLSGYSSALAVMGFGSSPHSATGNSTRHRQSFRLGLCQCPLPTELLVAVPDSWAMEGLALSEESTAPVIDGHTLGSHCHCRSQCLRVLASLIRRCSQMSSLLCGEAIVQHDAPVLGTGRIASCNGNSSFTIPKND